MMYNLWLKINTFKRYYAFSKELDEYIGFAVKKFKSARYRDALLKLRTEEIWKKHGSPIVDLVEYEEFKNRWLGE